MMNPWDEMRHAALPPRLWGGPHRCSRPAGLPPLVACGRDEGGSGVRRRAEAEAEAARRRREGGGGRAEREEAAAAGGNAVADAGGFSGGGAERFAGFAASLVAREDRGSGGGGEAGRKRGLAPTARSPPNRSGSAAGLPAREDRGSGGGGEFRRKRGLAPPARPPPKRSAACLPAREDRGSGGGGEFRRKRGLAPPAITDSFATSKKSKTAQSKHLPVNAASTSALGSKEKRSFNFLFISKEKLKDKVASHLEDDDVLKALAVHDGKLELYLNVPSCVPSIWCHRQDRGQNADARSKVRMMCRRFQFLCRFLVQAVEQRLLEVPRVDLAADKVIKQLPGFTRLRPIVGKVPGVEVGDVFLFRVELAIVGLHSPYRGGIGTTKDVNGVLIAISIVASGGYHDVWSSSSELIYTGSGGKAAGNEQDGDQKLQRGNLALKNCMKTKTPVRVIHGFKRQNREEESHSKGKEIPKFTYDGLYLVVDCWREGHPGLKVFKYKLQRIPGQPEVPLHVAKRLRKSAMGPGLSVADVSQHNQ